MLFSIFAVAPLYYAFNNMSIGTATLIFFSMFLITSYSLGYLFLGEKMTVTKIVALILAIMGLVVTFGIELGVFSLLALCLAALNGIASGGEVTMTKKVTAKYSSFQISVIAWAAILVTHLPLAIIAGESFVNPAIDIAWVSMLAYAVIGLLSFWFVIEGYRFIDASIGGLIGLLEIIVAIIFGVILFGEVITLSTIVGGGLIIFAAMLPNLVDIWNRKKKN
jgi:drug/metabolite transporter (DMT)-like permease